MKSQVVLEGNPNQFTYLNEWIACTDNDDIDYKAWSVMVALLRYVRLEKKTGFYKADPSYKQISAMVKFSEKSVQRGLNELEKKGYINSYQRMDNSKMYTIKWGRSKNTQTGMNGARNKHSQKKYLKLLEDEHLNEDVRSNYIKYVEEITSLLKSGSETVWEVPKKVGFTRVRDGNKNVFSKKAIKGIEGGGG